MKKFIFKVTAYFMAFIAAGSIPLAFSSKDITAPDAVIKFLFFGSLFTGCIILVQILEKKHGRLVFAVLRFLGILLMVFSKM